MLEALSVADSDVIESCVHTSLARGVTKEPHFILFLGNVKFWPN